MKQLWAPWRLAYVANPKPPGADDECFICKGLADADDSRRGSYLVRHLAVVSNAIDDGVDIRGYVTWSLLDNLEWILGYEPKYGLYSFDPVTLERTPRSSVAVIHQITTTNSIPAELFQQYRRSRSGSAAALPVPAPYRRPASIMSRPPKRSCSSGPKWSAASATNSIAKSKSCGERVATSSHASR